MNIRERIRQLIAEQLGIDKLAGPFFVSIKKTIVEAGCRYAEEAIAEGHEAWTAFIVAYDFKWIPEAIEQQGGEFVWGLIEKGVRLFLAKVCPVQPPAPDGGVRFAATNLAADPEVVRMANDPTLPTA